MVQYSRVGGGNVNVWLNMALGNPYKSVSQQTRVISEDWVNRNMFCPRCGNAELMKCKNNRPVSDFICNACGNVFEVKATAGKFGHKINDGAYHTMMERIHSDTNPDFLFMEYQKQTAQVHQLFMVPKFYITDRMIEKRKPLGPTARRADWTGCFIVLDTLPLAGRIAIIQDGCIQDKTNVCRQYEQTDFIKQIKIHARGWILDVLRCIERIPDDSFSLQQMYDFTPELSILHPDNHNIQAKIRQQLQFLRDKGVLEFLGDGMYRKRIVF